MPSLAGADGAEPREVAPVQWPGAIEPMPDSYRSEPFLGPLG
jgi:hypothetical protein